MKNENLFKGIMGDQFDWMKKISQPDYMTQIGSNALTGMSFMDKFNIGVDNKFLNYQNMFNSFDWIKEINKPLSNSLFLSPSNHISNFPKNLSLINNSLITDTAWKNTFNFTTDKLIPDFTKAFAQLPLGTSISDSFHFNFNQNLIANYIGSVDVQEQELDIATEIEELTNIVTKLSEDIHQGTVVVREYLDVLNTKMDNAKRNSFVLFLCSLIIAVMLFGIREVKSTQGQSSQNDQFNELKEIVYGIKMSQDDAKETQDAYLNVIGMLSKEKRIAITDVYLRSKPSSKSGELGVVLKGSDVLVQKVNHKWLFIAFQNEESILVTGWVYKKYFKTF